ncbi:hypothetical protein NDU88_002366 [Pleurodeles waltl]|uniref:Uncharacterized protein n=1 Tax=Pleurodeles waltl TaxID=8319 RepID=A0AAV7VZ44_PLEWA|nr:hypothetical protein NDU88_002366 [Pleurodeles waltl]
MKAQDRWQNVPESILANVTAATHVAYLPGAEVQIAQPTLTHRFGTCFSGMGAHSEEPTVGPLISVSRLLLTPPCHAPAASSMPDPRRVRAGNGGKHAGGVEEAPTDTARRDKSNSTHLQS